MTNMLWPQSFTCLIYITENCSYKMDSDTATHVYLVDGQRRLKGFIVAKIASFFYLCEISEWAYHTAKEEQNKTLTGSQSGSCQQRHGI